MAIMSETDTKDSSLTSEKAAEIPSEDSGAVSSESEDNSPQDNAPDGGARAWLYVLAAFFVFINAW